MKTRVITGGASFLRIPLCDKPLRPVAFRSRSAASALSRRSGVTLLAAAVLLLAGAGGDALAATTSSSLVNTIDTSRWSPPSPDPSALAYDSLANRLLVTDGEVEEMSIYAGANLFEASLGGNLARTANTLAFTPEPVGASFDTGGRLFISDDDRDRVYQVSLGANAQFDASDPVTSFSTASFGATDPEGSAYDRAGDRLFIADGVGAEIYEVSPVDGVFGNGNDQSRHFDTAALGIVDPETVEFNPDTGTLFTIGDQGDAIVEVTTSGALASRIDTSQVPLSRPAGMTYAPRSADPTKKSFYVSDRKVDNDNHPTENDGAIYEIAPEEAGGGTPPPGDRRVAASSDDAEETSGASVDLTSSDLELVTDGTTNQTVGVRFADLPIPPGATVTGAYIQFTADESQSEPTSLNLSAQTADNASTFTTAPGNVSSRSSTNASVAWSPAAWTAGAAGSDQRTPDLAPVIQEVVSRPGWASGNALTLKISGTGHRTSVAFDGGATKAPLLHVEYLPAGEANRPPTVSAGADQTVTLPASVALDGTVSDDGRPNPTPTTSWTKVSGPGTVSFADAGAVDTRASLSEPGAYVLRLTADDGELRASDELSVTAKSADFPIALMARGYKVKGRQRVDLTWSGASSSSVDIWRNGVKVETTPNDGSHTDNIDKTGGGTYRYRVCQAGSSTCSDEVPVTFG